MKIVVAKTAGFCWGVRRAMDAVLEASARDKGQVQTLGPLIHNPQALELIGKRGVRIAGSPVEVTGGTVVIRAHGIPIQDLRGLKERQRKGELTIVNATCPEVAKVHSRIKKYSPQGYFTVILGTHGHAESVAHQSFADHGSAIVASMEEAKALTDEQLQKVLVVAQTTFTLNDFKEISDYLRTRAQDLIVENTICDDTWTRQEEAKELAKTVDSVIVIGGKNSSNTKHLAELAQHYGKPVQFVETACGAGSGRHRAARHRRRHGGGLHAHLARGRGGRCAGAAGARAQPLQPVPPRRLRLAPDPVPGGGPHDLRRPPLAGAALRPGSIPW